MGWGSRSGFGTFLLLWNKSMPTRHQLSRYPDHVQAIGLIALETVDLELELTVLFSRMLMLLPRVGEAIYMTPKNAQARLDIMRNAAKETFRPSKRASVGSLKEKQKAAALKKVLGIIGRAQECMQKRHRALHDDWYISADTKEIKRIQVDGLSDRVGKPIPLPTLKAEIKSLRTLIDDVTKLAKEFKEKPPQLVSMRRNT
jgi:hypothetical protein